MSTGSSYDMILLSIKGPGGARVAPTRMRAPRRPHHHASPPKKRRGQRHHRLSASPRPAVRARQETARGPIAPCTTGMTAQRRKDHTTGMTAPPPPGYSHMGCSPQEEPCRSAWTMSQRHSPGRYAQTLRHTWRDQWSSHAALERSDRRPSYTITSLRQRLLEERRGCFYTAEPDSGSESDSHDPTRECFHVDGAVETTVETQDAVAGGRAPAAREDPRTPGNDGQVDPPPQ